MCSKVTFGLAGILSLFLGSFSEEMWAYLTASFLQGMLYSPALVLLNVLYFEPLEDCAGLAAAFEIVAQDFLAHPLLHGLHAIFDPFRGQKLYAAAISGFRGYSGLLSWL